MRKKFLVMAATAAALTLATGITAFAGTWQSDTWGSYYQNDDGSRPVYAGWFTDPADGAMYYMDPDGYVMTDTTVEGYKLGPDGKRIEKTDEDLAREAERKAYIASRPSPAKKAASAEVAAAAAKTSTAAAGTTRTTYLAEMTAFMDKIFIATADKRTDTTIVPYTNKNNTELTYAFSNPDGYRFINAALWKVSKSTAADYHENSAEISYHYDAVGDPDRNIYTAAFEELTIAAVGDTEGKNIVDAINTERAAGTVNFDRSGQTDAGNSYTLTYRNNLATLKIVCSEIVPQTDADTEEAAPEETAVEETTPAVTTSVIVAGQASNTSSEEDTTQADTAESTETVAADTES